MSRSPEQRDLDRQALVDVLRNGARMYTKQVIAAAQGVHISQVAPLYAQSYQDLAWLQKAGVVASEYSVGGGNTTTWWFVGEFDSDAESDRREVERLMAGWVEAS